MTDLEEVDISRPMPRHAHRNYTKAYRRLTEHRSLRNNNPTHTTIAEEIPLPDSYSLDTTLTRAYTAASYAQTCVVLTLSFAISSLVLLFSTGILGDLFRKTRIRAENNLVHSAECAVNRINSGCMIHANGSVAHQIPAMSVMCQKWHACESRARFAWLDALSASVCAETAAEVINAFTQHISSTSVLIGLLLILVVVAISSCAFGVLHNKVVQRGVVTFPPVSQPVLTLQHDDDTPRNAALLPLPEGRTYAITQ